MRKPTAEIEADPRLRRRARADPPRQPGRPVAPRFVHPLLRPCRGQSLPAPEVAENSVVFPRGAAHDSCSGPLVSGHVPWYHWLDHGCPRIEVPGRITMRTIPPVSRAVARWPPLWRWPCAPARPWPPRSSSTNTRTPAPDRCAMRSTLRTANCADRPVPTIAFAFTAPGPFVISRRSRCRFCCPRSCQPTINGYPAIGSSPNTLAPGWTRTCGLSSTAARRLDLGCGLS